MSKAKTFICFTVDTHTCKSSTWDTKAREFKANMNYTARHCLKKPNQTKHICFINRHSYPKYL